MPYRIMCVKNPAIAGTIIVQTYIRDISRHFNYYPGILEMYFSICFIWSTICGVVGFNAFVLRKKSLAALNSRLFIMMLHICR